MAITEASSAAQLGAIEDLARDPGARRRMGAAGIQRIALGWDLDTGVKRLHRLLRAALPAPADPARAVVVSGVRS